MTLREIGADPTLRSLLIGIGSFASTILLILGTNAQGLAILA